MTERVTRSSMLITMPDGYSTPATLAGLVEAFETVPAWLRHSVTFDQGSEWALWGDLTATYGLHASFCDPHPPWQRGHVENLNRQWRCWFTRGTDFSTIEPGYTNAVATTINGQRRCGLDYHSPTMLYAALTVQ